jgi:hypothetical protein
MAKFKERDRVRFGNEFQFAIVQGFTGSSVGDNVGYELNTRNSITETKRISAIPEKLLIGDLPIRSNTFWFDRSAKKRVQIISRSKKAKPGKNESEYDYVAQQVGATDRYTVNGCWLAEGYRVSFIENGTPAEQEESFFNHLYNPLSLTAIPPSMRSKGFVIAYRGDSRPYTEVFNDGFKPKSDYLTPIFRSTVKIKSEEAPVEGKGRIGAVKVLEAPKFDLLSESGVCCAHKPEAGCIFPMPEKAGQKDTVWLYAFFAYQIFNTFKIQEKCKSDPKFADHIPVIEAVMTAEEMAIGKEGQPGETIIAGFKIDRQWKTEKWWEGCALDVTDFKENPDNFYADGEGYSELLTGLRARIEGMKSIPAVGENLVLSSKAQAAADQLRNLEAT